MIPVTPDVLRAAWVDLGLHAPRAREFRTTRLETGGPLDMYAALRAVDEAPCLLLPVVAPASALFEVGGMRLAAARGDEGPLLVLSLEDPGRADLFATLCCDVIRAATTPEPDDGVRSFLERLAAWRRFLREQRSGLSRREVTGLIGELLVLVRLLARRTGILSSWVAPDDGLHDFLHRGHALEIKTSLGLATSLHISTLDQLDHRGLNRLDLLHLHLVEDPGGQALGTLIEAIEGVLPDDRDRRAFANALLRRGLMPDDAAARSAPVVSLRSIDAYRVGDGFPRLTRAAVPAGLVSAVYELDVRSLRGHAAEVEGALLAFVEGILA